MNDLPPGTPTASNFFDAFVFSNASSYAIPETLAIGIPETRPDPMEMLEEQDTVSLPALRLPQIAPSQVIAMRQRSLIPATSMQPRETIPTRAQLARMVRQGPGHPDGAWNETSAAPKRSHSPLTPRPNNMGSTPVTPSPDGMYYRNVSKHAGMTYIPRSMSRRPEPTVVDALIACGTLILLCFCVLLFLYYVGL